MQIVVNIDEETYNDIKKGKIYSSFRDVPQESVNAIANGIPLPKECDIQRIIPKRVNVQKWIYTKCPNNCGYELSTHHGDGYYSIEHKPSFCPNCGQALLWESEEEYE